MTFKYIILLLGAQLVFASDFGFMADLSKKELNSIERGEIVIHTKESKESWPTVIMYQAIKASPLESVAIFYAIDHQKNYVPNLIQSDVIKHISPTKVLTKYTMDMPWPLSDSHYIHGSELFHHAPSQYKVTWWMKESDTANKVEGYASFIPYKDLTIMKYHAYVEPKSFFARFIESQMISDVKTFMEKVKEEIQKIKANKNSVMKKYVSFIDDALKGIEVYKK